MVPHPRWLLPAACLALSWAQGPADQPDHPRASPPPGAVTHLGVAEAPPQASALALAFAPDGKTVALGRRRGLSLWEVATGKEIRRLTGHAGDVSAAAFSPNGRLVASAGQDGTVRLWETATGKERRSLVGHRGAVLAVAFAPDGRRLASAGRDQTVRLRDPATGREVSRLRGHPRPVYCVAFSPDGRLLASGGKDRTVRLWDPDTGTEIRRLQGHYNRVNALAFSADGKMLASASQDSTIRLWEPASGKAIGQLGDYYGEVKALVLSADGRTVAGACRDRSIHVWEVFTGKERGQFQVGDQDVLALALSPDGRLLASAGTDRTARLWDLTGLRREGQAAKVRATPRQLEVLWTDLASPDAARAYRAVWRLSAVPAAAVPFLETQLRLEMATPGRIAGLIADLDDHRFATRDRATRELEALGKVAEPALRRALEGHPSAEARQRLRQLLGRLGDADLAPAWVRVVRAVEALERIGSPEARKVLQGVAAEKRAGEPAREARASLERLRRRGGGTP